MRSSSFLFVFLVSILYTSSALALPGWVSSNLQIWLRADDNGGVTTDGGEISTWDNLQGDDFPVYTSPNIPSYEIDSANMLNFNPVVFFDSGTTHEYYYNTTTNFGLTGREAHVYSVTRLEATSGVGFSQHGIFSPGPASPDGGLEYTFNVGVPNNVVLKNYNGDVGINTGIGDITEPKLVGVSRDSSGVNVLSHNGLSSTQATTLVNWNSATRYYLGANHLHGALNGGLSEILVYNRKLTASEISQVESYLAFKYGISLDQTSSQDYVASDGTTIIWDSSVNASYASNIFGIGRDDDSDLDQRISSSENAGTVLTISLDDDFTSPNNDVSRTTAHTNNLQFLSVASNTGTTATQTIEVDLSEYAHRIGREWQIYTTENFTQDVYLEFDGFDDTYQLLVDSDGDFSSGATSLGALFDDGTIQITPVDGQYFTLAKTIFPAYIGSLEYDWTDAYSLDDLVDLEVSLDTSLQGETDLQEVVFSHNGDMVFVAGIETDSIIAYDLASAFDLSTATYSHELDVSDELHGIQGFTFAHSDGTKLYAVGFNDFNGEVVQYKLRIPYDLTSAIIEHEVDILEETDPSGIIFTPNLSSFSISSDNEEGIRWYNLLESGEIDTIFSTAFIDLSAYVDSVEAHIVHPDGERLYIADKNDDEIEEFELTTPFDISTATHIQTISVPSSTAIRGLAWGDSGVRLYLADNHGSAVLTYEMDAHAYQEVPLWGYGDLEDTPLLSISISAGTTFDDLGSGALTTDQVTVGNVPAGLDPVLTIASPTLLHLTFDGNAVAHELEDTLENLTFIFADSAFDGADASDLRQSGSEITYNSFVGIDFFYQYGGGWGGSVPSEISGCTDVSASNYDDEAGIDDGSCAYTTAPTPVVTEDDEEEILDDEEEMEEILEEDEKEEIPVILDREDADKEEMRVCENMKQEAYRKCDLGKDFSSFEAFAENNACEGFIVARDDVVDKYELDKSALRQEVAAVAFKMRKMPHVANDAFDLPFSDIDSAGNDWLLPVIQTNLENNIITSKQSLFRPLEPTTRAETFAMLMASVCMYPTGPDGDWQKKLYDVAYEHGITERTYELFEFDRYVTRAEMFVISSRLSDWAHENGGCDVRMCQ